MAFDAGMLACMVHEIRTVALGGRIEKVMQPERDEIILQLMNRLMTGEQWEYLRKRNIIESDWGVLKQNYFLEYHQARSIIGLFRHYVCCISAYILECRLKSFPRIKTRI